MPFLFQKQILKSSKILFFFSFFSACSFLAWLAVWQPVYFLIFLTAFLFLIIVFWKTEGALFFLIFYLPFQIALNITSGIDLSSGRLLIAILFLIWLAKSLAGKKLYIPFKKTTALLALFLILAVFSAVFSIDTERSAIRLLFFFSIIPLYLVSAVYLNSGSKIIKAIYLLIASAVLAALAGIVQFFSQFIFGIDSVMNFLAQRIAAVFYGQSFSKIVLANPSWLVNISGATYLRALSLFPDPHMFAFYLGLVMPVALVLFLFSEELKFSFEKKALVALVNGILFLALLLTFSRAGYLGAFFGIGIVILFGWKILGKKAKFLIITAGLIAAIFILNSSNLVVSRFFAIFNLAEGSNSERVANWRQAGEIIKNYPATGVGVGAYSLAIDPRAQTRTAISAHNSYLDIAAEMGIFAAIVWFLLLFFSILKLLAVFRRKYDNRDFKAKAISLGLLGALVWLAAQSFFDTAIYSPVLLPLLMIYFALAVNLEEKEILSK